MALDGGDSSTASKSGTESLKVRREPRKESEMAKEVRSLGENQYCYVSQSPDAHPAEGKVLVHDFQVAPWGFDNMGFSEVSREWLEANSTLLPDDHTASRLVR